MTQPNEINVRFGHAEIIDQAYEDISNLLVMNQVEKADGIAACLLVVLAQYDPTASASKQNEFVQECSTWIAMYAMTPKGLKN